MSAPGPLDQQPKGDEAHLSFGTPGGHGPLVFAVPHAGRAYSQTLMDRACVQQHVLSRLEDRLADHLVLGLIEQGHHVLIARHPRAMIDLNRDEREFDPRAVSGMPWNVRGQTSAKVRGGLGLIPERLAALGNLWRTALPYETLAARIEHIHRPYHAALAAALEATRQRHGVALLIDVHSMPPLRPSPGFEDAPPRVVIGDRFGRSAIDRLTDLCADVMRRQHIPVAINSPYSGNHILERHGRPAAGIHAIQIEFDRTLYLEQDLMTLGTGIADIHRMLAELAMVLGQELSGSAFPLAAE